MTHWEYRIVTFWDSKPDHDSDDDRSQRLTNVSKPGIQDQEDAAGWEIFAVRPLDGARVRLYMKRPARPAAEQGN